MGSSELMNTYLWSTNDCNASWTINGFQGFRPFTKPVFIPRQLIHGCRYCSLNNTNDLCLLVRKWFGVKKKIRWKDKSVSKNKSIPSRTSVLLSSPQPFPDTDDWIASYIALFKSRNYGNFVHVYTHSLYC